MLVWLIQTPLGIDYPLYGLLDLSINSNEPNRSTPDPVWTTVLIYFWIYQ